MPAATRETLKTFSIMSFNIAHGRGLSLYQGFHTSSGIRKNLEKIARLIKRHSPDIVAFQEIDQSSHWNRHIDLLKHIQEESGYPHAEHGIHNTRYGRKPLCYGNAFLSKYPISDCTVTPFGNRDLGEKGFMDARFQVGSTSIDIINLHLDFGSRRARIAQIEPILDRIKSFSESQSQENPPIICGDFNTCSRRFSDAVRQFLIKAARHAHYTYHPQNKRTFPAHLPSRGLDFVLVPQPYQVSQAEVIKSFASDHLPVQIRVELPGQDDGAFAQLEMPSLEHDVTKKPQTR
jgi:endonuclease/exonuclease/phosphatase family metal-dependent hydrolase